MKNTYDQNVDLIIDQLDAELRRRCPAYYDIYRRSIIAGKPSLRVIALRYLAAIKDAKSANKRQGRATARRIAQALNPRPVKTIQVRIPLEMEIPF